MELEEIDGLWWAFPVDKYGMRPNKAYWVSGTTRKDAITNYQFAYETTQVSVCKTD